MAEGKSYDYVLVGAGSAGCVLAYRLTADPPLRVLLLDAGGRDTHPLIHIPIGLGKIWQHRMFDWGYDTEPEPRLGNRRIEVMRGKVLGGSSSINVMAYVRGHRGDYEHMPQGCVPWPEELARPCGDRSSWRDIAIGEHLDAAIARGGRASAGTGDPRATPWWRAASVRDAHSPRARRSHRPRPR